MTPLPVPAHSETTLALCVVFIFLVPFAGAGLALISTGLGRSRSAAHAMVASLCVMSVAALAFFVFGYAWAGFLGGPAHSFLAGGKSWNWLWSSCGKNLRR